MKQRLGSIILYGGHSLVIWNKKQGENKDKKQSIFEVNV